MVYYNLISIFIIIFILVNIIFNIRILYQNLFNIITYNYRFVFIFKF